MSNIRCTATTKSGRPCRAWAVHYTDPPLCSSHIGRTDGAGAPESNKNRLTHGFYSRYFTLQEVSDLLSSADDTTMFDLLYALYVVRVDIAEEESLQSSFWVGNTTLEPSHTGLGDAVP